MFQVDYTRPQIIYFEISAVWDTRSSNKDRNMSRVYSLIHESILRQSVFDI